MDSPEFPIRIIFDDGEVQEIASADGQVKGHSEMDALVDYLQMLKFHGDALP